jgi:hypothetical protein
MLKKKNKFPNALFFWNRKPQKSASERLEEILPVIIKYIPDIRKLMRQSVDATTDSDGVIIGQMYDFVKAYDNSIIVGGWHTPDAPDNAALMDANGPAGDFSREQSAGKKERIKIKPKDVCDKLETCPTPWSNKDLDKKIAVLKDKSLLSNQRFVSAQIDGMIKRLENRKRYPDGAEFYERFKNTNDDAIDALLQKYKLVLKESTLFIPTFPDEATQVMKEYSIITEKLTKEKPVFYVIAEETDFKEKLKRLDPILLVQSPFGFYWQILGAWDKEMILLSEL